MKPSAFKVYQIALWALVFLFTLRVAGQLIQQLSPVPYLPDFEQWQGSNLPYWLLLLIQILLIFVMIYFAYAHSQGKPKRSVRKGYVLLGLGIVYFVVMLVRLIVGIFGLSDLPWFQKLIPASFHLVIASFMIMLSTYHISSKRGSDASH